MTTAIIPARGGSKGLRLKNLRTIRGQTLLSRCIATCKLAGLDVLVSTDNGLIAGEAVACHAKVVMRPAELATDEATSWEVVRHAIKATDAEKLLLVQCTAPLLTPGDLLGCLDRLETCDLAVCVHECHDMLVDGNGGPLNWSIPPKRRQDMEPQYRISGSAWAFDRDYPAGDEYHGRVGLVLSENPFRLDIDTEADLRLAELLIDRPQRTREQIVEMMLTG